MLKKMNRKQKRLVAAVITAIIVLGTSAYLIGYQIYAAKLKEILLPKCEEYINLCEHDVPSEIIGMSQAERDAVLGEKLVGKEAVILRLYSKNLPDNVKPYENIKSTYEYASKLKHIVTYDNQELNEFIKLKIEKKAIKVVYSITWEYRTIDFGDDGIPGKPEDYSGSSYYQLTFAKEDGDWKIINEDYNPFTAASFD